MFDLHNLIYAVLAILMVFATARIRDVLTGVKFRDQVLPKILECPIATAVYYGSWAVGTCILSASMLGV